MLTKRAKYAIKSLLFLYRNKEKAPVSAKTISEQEQIPYKFLENILRELKQHRILKSGRGPEGGYSFAKPPESITIADVIRAIDGPIALIPCVSETSYERCAECADEATCNIRRLFAIVREKMLPILEMSVAQVQEMA